MNEPMTRAGRRLYEGIAIRGRENEAAAQIVAIEMEAARAVMSLSLTDDHQVCEEELDEAKRDVARLSEIEKAARGLYRCRRSDDYGPTGEFTSCTCEAHAALHRALNAGAEKVQRGR